MKLSHITTAALLLAVASLGACKKDEGATPPAPTTGEAPAAPATGTEAPAAGTTNTEAGHH